MRGLAVVACLLALDLAGCGDEGPGGLPASGTVEGIVTELETERPVTDASVVLLEPSSLRTGAGSTLTDASGHYRIDRVPPGEYSFVVYQDSLVVFDRPLLQVAAGHTTRRDLRLQHSQLWNGRHWRFRITGTVLDDITDEPLPGAHVVTSWLTSLDIDAPLFGTTLPEMAVTDAQGHFALKQQGVYVGTLPYLVPISVTRQDYEPVTLVGREPEVIPGTGPMIPAPEDSILVVDVRLQRLRPGALRGTVRGRLAFAGQAVAGVRVGLSLAVAAHADTIPGKAGSDWIATPLPDRVAVSDRQGAFEISNIPFGTYTVVAAYPANDGWVAGWLRKSEHPQVAITRTAAVDVGTLELAKALAPLHPADGSVTPERSPEIRWEPLTGLPEGYSLVDYVLNIDDGYVLGVIIHNLHEPRWQVPVSIRPNAHMRWLVDARVVRAGSPDTLVLGQTERAATFTVASAVSIIISPGTTPTFSWEPPDPVSWLTVEGARGEDQWFVTTDSTNAIVPPVRYGDVPGGARELVPARALIAGSTYQVGLAQATASGQTDLIAIRPFTP